MNDPQPLKRITSHAFVRELLQSVEADRSPAGAAERALSVLGIGALSATGAALVVSQEAATTAHAGVSGLASKGVALASLKWVCVGFFGGLVTAGGAAGLVVKPLHSEVTRAIGSVRSARPVVPQGGPVLAVLPTIPDAGSPTPLPNEPRAALAAPVSARLSPVFRESALPQLRSAELASAKPHPTSESNGGALAQLEALRVIRQQLNARAPGRALALLDAFDRGFGTTNLAEEAIVLRVEALVELGRARESRQLGATFLVQHPNSAYARRVRAILGLP